MIRNTRAGVRDCRVRRSTGTIVTVYDGLLAGLDTVDDSMPYSTICEEHGWIICHPNLTLAKAWASRPEEWCEYCQDFDAAVYNYGLPLPHLKED